MLPVTILILTTFIINCNSFLEQHENGFSEADINALKTQLETEQAKRILLENNLSVVMGKLEALKQQVQTLQQTACTSCHKSGPQAFKAKMSHGSALGTNQHLVYDIVIINEGNGYDPKLGIFTAQVNGTYTFSITACTQAGHWIIIAIMKDGVQIGQSLTGDQTYNDCNAETTVAHLVQGDKVWVQHESSHGDILIHAGSNWNSFSGILSEADF